MNPNVFLIVSLVKRLIDARMVIMHCTTIFFLLLSVNVLLVAAQNAKAGSCPPPLSVDVCYTTCEEDLHCRGSNKCCPTECGGTFCVEPIGMRTVQQYKEKSGYCPSNPTGPWVCTSRCAVDGDCRGRSKCCRNRCGALACMKPDLE